MSLFFEDFKKQLTEIERYCGHSTREEWYDQLLRRIEWHNNYFIASHLNDPIFSNICGRSLDNEQRRAVLCDSNHNLVVAGAGTGKTLTICGKIQYLLENNLAKENEILLMSYSRDSVDDINKKVARVSPKMKAETFHSLGYAILTEHYGEKKAIEDQILSHIKAFFEERLSSDTKFTQKIFKYFSCYIRSITFDFRKKENDEEEQDWTLKKPYRTLKE
ncbi:UvrD-helicase domain-containing protein, partial [bacterium]|nr:UvrD-helicase domain-containing protein [bacterium]